jgi:hypothetical protein
MSRLKRKKKHRPEQQPQLLDTRSEWQRPVFAARHVLRTARPGTGSAASGKTIA